jgi:hypothetical protein
MNFYYSLSNFLIFWKNILIEKNIFFILPNLVEI